MQSEGTYNFNVIQIHRNQLTMWYYTKDIRIYIINIDVHVSSIGLVLLESVLAEKYCSLE